MITPPNAQVVMQVALTTGFPPASTSGTPGVQGTGWGVHAWGVSTPDAAAVALTTAGLANEEQVPNGGTFITPAKSWMVATGLPSTSTCVDGSTVSVAGAAPNGHVMRAVAVVRGAGMSSTVRRRSRPRPVRAARLHSRVPDCSGTERRRSDCPIGQVGG